MASETVDPIDWLHPPPYTGQYPLSSTYAHCNAGWAANHETYCTGTIYGNCGVLPTTQFAYRKGLGTCDALLRVSHTLQSALESGQEARIVQIDCSAAFDRVNHQGILYKLSSVGIGGSVLCV